MKFIFVPQQVLTKANQGLKRNISVSLTKVGFLFKAKESFSVEV